MLKTADKKQMDSSDGVACYINDRWWDYTQMPKKISEEIKFHLKESALSLLAIMFHTNSKDLTYADKNGFQWISLLTLLDRHEVLLVF